MRIARNEGRVFVVVERLLHLSDSADAVLWGHDEKCGSLRQTAWVLYIDTVLCNVHSRNNCGRIKVRVTMVRRLEHWRLSLTLMADSGDDDSTAGTAHNWKFWKREGTALDVRLF